MNVGDYVRYKKQYYGLSKKNDVRIAQILNICKTDYDEDFIFFVEGDGEFESQIIKTSPNIIDLIEVGDVIRFEIETPLETSGILKGVTDVTDNEMLEKMKKDNCFHVKSIVTKEQFEQMEYKIKE